MDEKYKQLIDIALDNKDFEWAKRLNEKSKFEDLINHLESTIPNKNIMLEDMSNNVYAVKTENGLKFPETIEEMERYDIVTVISKRENALKVLKGEEVDIEEISKEVKYIYKLAFQQHDIGFRCAKEIYYKDYEEVLRLRSQVETLLNTVKMLSSLNNK